MAMLYEEIIELEMVKYITSVLINNMRFYVLLGCPLKIVKHIFSK